MKIIITLCCLLITSPAYGSWSEFVHVTPGTEKKYGLNVIFAPIKNQENTFRIKFNAFDNNVKHAWLIITEKHLPFQEQEFRNYIWELRPAEKKILVKAKLYPQGEGTGLYYEVDLSVKQICTGYIYIDFPSLVLDGGYYYSIDLSSYLGALKNSTNQSIEKGCAALAPQQNR